MKAFSLFILTILLSCLFISCAKSYYEIDEKEKVDTESEILGDTLYIVNISSYSYHLSSCYMADRIKEENKVETRDIDFILEREYTPCKICIKE